MDYAAVRKALFYVEYGSILVFALLLLSASSIGYDPLTLYFSSGQIETFIVIFIGVVWAILIAMGKAGLDTDSNSHLSRASRAVLLFFMFFSTFFSWNFLYESVPAYYQMILVVSFIPLYTFQDLRKKKPQSSESPTHLGRNIAVFLSVIFSEYMILFGFIQIELIALFSLIFTLLSLGGKTAYSERIFLSVRIILPVSISFVLFEYYGLYGILRLNGVIAYALLGLAAILISVGLVYFRGRKVIFISSMVVLFISGIFGIEELFHFYNNYATLLLIATIVTGWFIWLSGKATLEDNRNIGDSFKIVRSGRLYFALVLAIAAYGYFRLFNYQFLDVASVSLPVLEGTFVNTLNYILNNTTGITSIIIIGVMGIAVAIGSRKINVILFSILILLFFAGLHDIATIRIKGVWDLPYDLGSIVAIIVTILVFYEPTFRFLRSYTSRIPRKFSLSFQIGSASYLYGRFDVDTRIDKKNNKDFLGAGGFAYVFRGRDMLTGRSVVLKMPRVFDEESKSEKEKKFLLQESMRQLYEESRILSKVNYPGIVKFVGYLRDGDRHFLAEEYVDGKNMSRLLGDRQKRGVAFDEQETIEIALNLLFSLNYLHLHDIYHRDLNPGNIVLTKSGPVIIDFGTSKSFANRTSTAFFTHSQRIGVPCYHPPELDLIDKISISPAYDTFSIGALMCSMLTGEFLDASEMKKRYGYEFITQEYLQMEIRPKCSDWLFGIISRSLSYKPEERYQSAFEMIADLLGIYGNFLVTDLGIIYPLEINYVYDVIISPHVKAPVPSKSVIRSKQIKVLGKGKNSEVKVGEISYSKSTGWFRYNSKSKVAIYAKETGSLAEKRNSISLIPRKIYSFTPDLKFGSFSVYTVRGH